MGLAPRSFSVVGRVIRIIPYFSYLFLDRHVPGYREILAAFYKEPKLAPSRMSGLVLGIWRYSNKPSHIQNGIASRTPYTGWWKWHHYAGLIFGAVMFTWVLSGLVSMSVFPSVTESFYTADQIKAQLPQLTARIPPAIKVETILDRTTTIRASVEDVDRFCWVTTSSAPASSATM